MSFEPDASERLARDGVVPLRKLLASDLIARLSDAVDRLLLKPPPGRSRQYSINGSGRFEHGFRLSEIEPSFEELALRSDLPRVAATLMKSRKIRFFFDQYIVKAPMTSSRTSWHSDIAYWPFRGAKIISFWIALDQADEMSGRLEFLPGSHEPQQARLPVPFVDHGEVPPERVGWNLNPGDGVAFSAYTIHGAGGNLSNRPRRAVVVRFLGDDVIYDPRPNTTNDLHDARLTVGEPIEGDDYPVVWPHCSGTTQTPH